MFERNFGKDKRFCFTAFWSRYEFYILPTFLVYRAYDGAGNEFLFLWLGIHISVGDTF